MCLAGIKMAEQAVLLYTSDTTSRLASPITQALVAEAQRLVQGLTQLLDVAGVKQRAGPVVIGAVKALGLCCLQRPVLLPTLLPPLLALAQQVRVVHERTLGRCVCEAFEVCGVLGGVCGWACLDVRLVSSCVCQRAAKGQGGGSSLHVTPGGERGSGALLCCCICCAAEARVDKSSSFCKTSELKTAGTYEH